LRTNIKSQVKDWLEVGANILFKYRFFSNFWRWFNWRC
jgi:hypothetical protein